MGVESLFTGLRESLTDRFELTETGQKLLDVIINPEARTWSVTRVCEVAGISRDSYYRLFKDSRFIAAYNETCQTACLSHAISVINSLASQAQMGDTAAGKIVLEMAGFYKPLATLNIDNHVEIGPTLRDLLLQREKKGSAL